LFLGFGCLAINFSVVWPIFVRLFGRFARLCLPLLLLMASGMRRQCHRKILLNAQQVAAAHGEWYASGAVVNEAIDIDSPAEHDGDVQKKDLRKM
jgi:hypothetical protein